MAKKQISLLPPSITKKEGRRRLCLLLENGEKMLANRPLKAGQGNVWYTSCVETIEATWGESPNHTYTFCGAVQMQAYGGSDDYNGWAENEDAARLAKRIEILKTLIDHIDMEMQFDLPTERVNQPSFWDDIHPIITQVAKARYEAGHFADCIEASLKEINAIVKAHVKQLTGQELDGASLMQKAFSPNGPLVALDDLSTESGKNIQQGYMQIFSGAMIGVRNPKAHANLSIDVKRARHFLYLASLLAYRFDERV